MTAVEEIQERVSPDRKIIEAESIERRAAPVEITFHMPVNRRKVSNKRIKVETDEGEESSTDKNSLYVSKALLDSDEYRALTSFKGRVRKFMTTQAVQTKIRMGAFMVSYENLAKVDRWLSGELNAWPVLVEELIRAYPRLKEEAKTRLDVLYDEGDYPTEEKLRACFGFEVRYFTYGVPNELRDFNSVIYDRERERVAQEWDDAIEEMKKLLRTNLGQLLKKAVDKLQPGPDGKPKQFKKDSLDKLNEFLTLFDARNVTDDRVLAEIVSKTRQVLSNVSTEDLKSSEQIREDVRKEFETVAENLDQLIENKPGRMVLLDSDDKEAA